MSDIEADLPAAKITYGSTSTPPSGWSVLESPTSSNNPAATSSTYTRPGRAEITVGDARGDIESALSVGDVIAPITGTARATSDNHTRTHQCQPGWIFNVELVPSALTHQFANLLDVPAYR